MTSVWKDLDKPQGLGKLNTYLSAESYIAGVQPTTADVEVFNALGQEPDKKWPHILRWYKHIAWFPEEQRAKWPAPSTQPTAAAAEATEAEPAKEEKNEDDDFDLFNETEEEKAAREKAKQERAAAAKPKKAVQLKSAVILDVKPLDDETDLAELEKRVRAIEKEGLEWKAANLVPVAFGIKKLQILAHIVDDIVSVEDDMIRPIEEMEDMVQSVDIFAFNKLN